MNASSAANTRAVQTWRAHMQSKRSSLSNGIRYMGAGPPAGPVAAWVIWRVRDPSGCVRRVQFGGRPTLNHAGWAIEVCIGVARMAGRERG